MVLCKKTSKGNYIVFVDGIKYNSIYELEKKNNISLGRVSDVVIRSKVTHEKAIIKLLNRKSNCKNNKINVDFFLYKMKPIKLRGAR